MAVRVIVQPPNKILTEKSAQVDREDRDLNKLLVDLHETLEAQVNPKGVGLSAPQLGVSKRVFVARPDADRIPMIMVNPEIMTHSRELTTRANNRKQLEGCLSIPDIYGEVIRHQLIKVEYWTTDWESLGRGRVDLKKAEAKFEGFLGRVFQHELDHLNGILFTMRVLEQGGKLYRLEVEDGEEVLTEVGL